MTTFSYPLRFKAIDRSKIWGVERWLVSALPSCPSIVSNGPLRGRRLDEILPGFPVLVKEISTNRWLSVQVHPGEEACKVTGGLPKSEMWRVLSPGPLMAGFKEGTTKADVEKAVAEGNVAAKLALYDTEIGDVFNIPPGLVHALGAGIRVFEVQQASDTTFRLYDWDRTDGRGVKRELHVRQSLASIDMNVRGAGRVKASEVRDFRFFDDAFDGAFEIDTGCDFAIVYCAVGEMVVAGERLAAGGCALLPPGMHADAESSKAQVLTVRTDGSFLGREQVS